MLSSTAARTEGAAAPPGAFWGLTAAVVLSLALSAASAVLAFVFATDHSAFLPMVDLPTLADHAWQATVPALVAPVALLAAVVVGAATGQLRRGRALLWTALGFWLLCLLLTWLLSWGAVCPDGSQSYLKSPSGVCSL